MKSDQYRGVLVIFVGVGIAASGVALSNVLSDELGLVGRFVFWIGWLVAGIGFIIHLPYSSEACDKSQSLKRNHPGRSSAAVMKKLVLALLVLVALSACDQKALFEKFVPQEEVRFSKEYLSLFRTGNYEAIEAKINPAIKDTALRAKLEQIAALFPQEEPKEVAVVGSHVLNAQNTQQTNLALQYEFSNKWLLASVVLERSGGALLVNGVNVQPLKSSLESLNRFALEGKSASHYVVLTAAVLVLLFIIGVLILCIRTPMPKRKWLWVVFVLLGFVQVTLNWTTGEMSVTQ